MYEPGASSLAWADRQVSELPKRWQQKLLKRWRADMPGESGHPEFEANSHLRTWADRLGGSRLPLDASDADICNAADQLAQRAQDLASVLGAEVKGGLLQPTGHIIGEFSLLQQPGRVQFFTVPEAYRESALRDAMARLAIGQGIEPPIPYNYETETGVQDGAAIARLIDAQWWRRKLRRVHAKIVEGAAIDLGYVNRARDCYVSNESVWRRAQQNERNAASLEATLATNELGQEYTLAELAAKGPANKAIRRAELMTRISGFERIAVELGHAGLFFTMTCPSRMHKWSTVKGQGNRVIENKRYDGTLPGEAQKYLAKVWARIRASLARQEIGQYGFRIAEPNHDGTPHWHLLVFVPPGELAAFQSTVWKYALKDSPNEPGAEKHRVDFKPIDAGRGTAAGYIAKYVAKNIDGYSLNTDLFGNDAIEASHRVEAWAATWSIRQFQQIGGPPVGVWRELRRIGELPNGAPKHLIDAHHAANKLTDIEAGTVKAVAWDRYIKAQGGVFCGRGALIKVATVQPEGINKYGEAAAPKVIGVETFSRELYTPDHMRHMPNGGGKASRLIEWIVESARHVWTITKAATARLVPEFNAASRPWTCVNNCTEKKENDATDTPGNSETAASAAQPDAWKRLAGHFGRAPVLGQGTGQRAHDGWRLREPDFAGA
jgi:hypothetical protein